MSRNSEVGAGGLILGFILILATAIIWSRMLLPWFVLGTIVSIISIILIAIYHVFFDQYGDSGDLIMYIGIFGGLCILGASATYFIGYIIGDSTFGQAALDVQRAFNLVQEVKQNATDLQFETLQSTTTAITQATNAPPETQAAINTTIAAVKIANELEN